MLISNKIFFDISLALMNFINRALKKTSGYSRDKQESINETETGVRLVSEINIGIQILLIIS